MSDDAAKAADIAGSNPTITASAQITAPAETWQHLIAKSDDSTPVKVFIAGKEETVSIASFEQMILQSVIEAAAGAVVRLILDTLKKNKERTEAKEEE